jgi:hypothetical protein
MRSASKQRMGRTTVVNWNFDMGFLPHEGLSDRQHIRKIRKQPVFGERLALK